MQVRPATGGDALAVADVHVRSWQIGYRGLLPQDHLDALDTHVRASRYTFDAMQADGPYTLVAEDDGTILGLATIGRCRDADLPDRGEVWALYTDHVGWGSGVGRLLIASARERLHRNSFTEASLWVLDGNARARRFYERDGWTLDGSRRADQIGDTTVDEVRYRRTLP